MLSYIGGNEINKNFMNNNKPLLLQYFLYMNPIVLLSDHPIYNCNTTF